MAKLKLLFKIVSILIINVLKGKQNVEISMVEAFQSIDEKKSRFDSESDPKQSTQ